MIAALRCPIPSVRNLAVALTAKLPAEKNAAHLPLGGVRIQDKGLISLSQQEWFNIALASNRTQLAP